jgi:hypothetical protein
MCGLLVHAPRRKAAVLAGLVEENDVAVGIAQPRLAPHPRLIARAVLEREPFAREPLHPLVQIVASPDTGYARFETAGGVTLSVQIDPEEKILATTAIYLECDDLDSRVEQLARSGVAFEHGPRNQPWMWREARLRDPDGNIIFFYHAGEARRFPPWRLDD